MRNSILLGGQVLHGEDRFGTWIVDELEGWLEAPAIKGDSTEREAADGDFVEPQHYGARTITIDGAVWCASRAQALQAIRTLGTRASNNMATLSVRDEGETTWASVRLEGVDYTFTDDAKRNFRYQLRLRAPNPRKFGATHELFVPHSTQTWLQHYGNYPAAPVFNMTGASATSGYDVRGPGGAIFTVTQPLVAGQSHRVDMRTGSLFVDGALTHGKVSRADVFYIQPGATGSVVRVVALTGSVIATASVTDTFI